MYGGIAGGFSVGASLKQNDRRPLTTHERKKITTKDLRLNKGFYVPITQGKEELTLTNLSLNLVVLDKQHNKRTTCDLHRHHF